MSDNMDERALLIEDILRRWFCETAAGRDIMANRGLSLNEAIDAGFELLNAGYIKIVGDILADKGEITIEPKMPPERPMERLFRPRKN